MPRTHLPAAGYLQALAGAVTSLPLEPIERLVNDFMQAWHQQKLILACGNGGSAANADHFVQDIGKSTIPPGAGDRPRFRVLSLSQSASYLLAWANDDGFDRIYVEQLANLASPGDVLLAISTSGRSRNVLLAAEWAQQQGLCTWALTGSQGSPLLEVTENAIQVPSDDVGIVETAHLAVIHWVAAELHARVAALVREGAA